MIFKQIAHGRALYAEKDFVWIAKGLTFFAIDYNGKRVTRKYTIGSLRERFVGIFRLPRQLLRVGIHHLLPLNNGNILVTLKKRTLIVSPEGTVINTFTGYRGNKPGHCGVNITPDGTIFFGEYSVNPNRDELTRLYRSTDNGLTFHNILTFEKDEICHIHFIQWDKYDNCLWIGTGDRDFECKLLRSDDNGDTWNIVGEGNQKWRAIRISCTKDALYWGTDAGSVPDQNYVIRMDKKNNLIETVTELEGPCHGNAITSDGKIYVSTGVEGGENEKDRYAYLKQVDGHNVNELFKLKKDIFPLIAQYGVMRFPLGMENTDKLIITAMGLRKGSESIYVEKN